MPTEGQYRLAVNAGSVNLLRSGIPPKRFVSSYSVGMEQFLKDVRATLLDSPSGRGKIRFLMGHWGSGKTHLLRLLRDSTALVGSSYVEFDLEAMMEGEVYADFVLFWLLCHESRVEGNRPAECWLERWLHEAQQQGMRALELLRTGVEHAIQALGSGFLAYTASSGNQALRDKLRSGELSTQDYYRQLLRLVYRLIVLFVAEDRVSVTVQVPMSHCNECLTKHYSVALA